MVVVEAVGNGQNGGFRTPGGKTLSQGSEGLRTEFQKRPQGGPQKGPHRLREEVGSGIPHPGAGMCPWQVEGQPCELPQRWDPSPQAPGGGLLGAEGEAPWSGLVNCSAACHTQVREHIPSAKGNAQHLIAIQYMVLEGVNGSMVLNSECPTVRVRLWPACP